VLIQANYVTYVRIRLNELLQDTSLHPELNQQTKVCRIINENILYKILNELWR